jgi:hypothetical protein
MQMSDIQKAGSWGFGFIVGRKLIFLSYYSLQDSHVNLMTQAYINIYIAIYQAYRLCVITND